MTFKIEISQIYDLNEPKQRRLNKQNETFFKSDIIITTFINGTFQFHCKSEQSERK